MNHNSMPTFKDPKTADLWIKLRDIIESRGEFGDPQTEFGVIRKVFIGYTAVKAELSIKEVVEPTDLNGPLAYRIERRDPRGEFELSVSPVEAIGLHAIRVAMRDLQQYVHGTEQSMTHFIDANERARRVLDLANWQRGVTSQNKTSQYLLDMYAMYGLNRADTKQLHQQLREEGYTDDEVILVKRIANGQPAHFNLQG
jgi:hypothetical protein